MVLRMDSRCRDILLPLFMDSLKHQHKCPLCSVLRNYEENVLESILYERVNDPEVRQTFLDSMGLCRYHAWLIVELSEEKALVDNLGPSLIYRDVLAKYLRDDLESKSSGCPVCRDISDYELMVVKWIAHCIDISEWFRSLYSDGKAVFCDRHYHMIISHMKNPASKRYFKSIHKRKIESILKRMKSYLGKKNYLSKEKISEEEVYAWITALEVLKGDRSFRGCNG